MDSFEYKVSFTPKNPYSITKETCKNRLERTIGNCEIAVENNARFTLKFHIQLPAGAFVKDEDNESKIYHEFQVKKVLIEKIRSILKKHNLNHLFPHEITHEEIVYRLIKEPAELTK